MAPSAQQQPARDDRTELETAAEAAIAACDGDARAAVRALLVTLGAYEADLTALRIKVDGITASVSRGYARGRFRAPGGGESR